MQKGLQRGHMTKYGQMFKNLLILKMDYAKIMKIRTSQK